MRAMAAEAEAARLANAKVVAAEGEHRASRSLHLAANNINGRPAALQVVISYGQSGSRDILDILRIEKLTVNHTRGYIYNISGKQITSSLYNRSPNWSTFLFQNSKKKIRDN